MTDCIIIGAGVIGLAIARAIAARGLNALILEREAGFGRVTSARSSEVIHAGLYHAPTTLKSRLCTEGRPRLYRYCEERGVPHRRCGKLIVATAEDQLPALELIRARAWANGVRDILPLSAAEATALEPPLRCHAALLSPSTGILDSHALMLALLGEAEAAGARLVCRTEVARACRREGAWRIELAGERETVQARCLVNAAGLGAQAMAAATEGFAAALIPPLILAKGSYFALAGRAPFSRLVYPLPEPGGAGIHLTLDLAGGARFGPDVQWVPAIDYAVDPNAAPRFAAEIRRYWPALPADRLAPAYAGIRPKLARPPDGDADFAILGPAEHGLPDLVALFGIESPGLTACLAIAEAVADRLQA